MISFERTILPNGLTLITHQEKNTSLVSVNVLYNVGARDENPDRTGFAHLFEHLMFGGSANIPDYDKVADNAGAENNAFTNNDITNYYITLPKQYLETALWLESDRMNQLAFSEKSLAVQKNVVTEEYHQRYINQPYGDLWLLLRPLAYKVHPYRWCTIGRDIAHVQNATLLDVEAFFYKYYRPNNAVIAIAGNIEHAETQNLVNKWFGTIPQGEAVCRNLPVEPEQIEARTQTVSRNVPASVIIKSYKMCDRRNSDYYVFDLISDILSNGKSSRLYNELVTKQRLFTKIDAYITGDIDEGQFVITGYLSDKISSENAEKAVDEQLDAIAAQPVSDYELQKVKNNVETTLLFSQYKCIERAMRLAYFQNLGDAAWANAEPQMYANVTANDIMRVARQTFQPQRCATLYYMKNEK